MPETSAENLPKNQPSNQIDKTIGLLITARMGSSRLRQKHLSPVSEKPILQFLIDRMAFEFKAELELGIAKIVIATSDEPENRGFEKFSNNNVSVFYGAVDNIPLRHLQTANCLGFGAVVSVDGDDPLCSPKAMRAIFEELKNGGAYAKTENLPLGMNVSGYSTAFLESSVGSAGHGTFETGWFRIFDQTKLKIIHLPFHFEGHAKDLRLTLDYEKDYLFFKAVIEDFGEQIVSATDEEISCRALNRGYNKINSDLNETYFNNFYSKMAEEQNTPQPQ